MKRKARKIYLSKQLCYNIEKRRCIMIHIEKFIPNEEENIVVGCSAGPDSMALLHYLIHNTKNKIICCHINHNVRKESKEEEKYLKNYCQKQNVPFEVYKIEKYGENNFENEARIKRYNFYEQTLKKYNSHYLFLAHHGDDLIETIIMKINRGSNLEGYAGIKEISKQKDYIIIRPFLSYTKEDLLDYNERNNIEYFIDKTNLDTTYTRNRIRANILPVLKNENKDIHKQFLKYSKVLLEYNTYIEEVIKEKENSIYKDNILDLNLFKKEKTFIQKNVLYHILNNTYQNIPNIITDNHINNILKIINSPTPNLSVDLPKNKQARKTYNKLIIKEKEKNPPLNYKVPLQEENIFGSILIKKINKTSENGNDICRLNTKNITLPLYFRNKLPGDKISLYNSPGTKKVSDIFIDKKVSKEKRETYPILVDAKDQIIWIPNLKKSKFNSNSEEFYDIILKYCEKEEKNEQ